ncbi:MAG: hypothetical protein KA347_06605 [Bacteroidia bacterium]|nr:hypothetical protein [Bacteroidia bacterium]
MKELKKLIIDCLCTEYPIEEATRQVNDSTITIKGELVRVQYENGKIDDFKIITTETLVLIS